MWIYPIISPSLHFLIRPLIYSYPCHPFLGQMITSSILPSIHLSIIPSIHLRINHCVLHHLQINPSTVNICIHQAIVPLSPTCPSIHPFTDPCIDSFITCHPFMSQIIYPTSIHSWITSIYLSIILSPIIYKSIYPSVSIKPLHHYHPFVHEFIHPWINSVVLWFIGNTSIHPSNHSYPEMYSSFV